MYDLVILGAGPGGYTAAIRAALKGAKVAVIEEDTVGGVCLNRGCIPSKSLIAGANLYQKMKQADSFGIRLSTPPQADWPAMLGRKDKIVGGLVSGIKSLFKGYGVDLYNGFGSFRNPHTIHVQQNDDTELDIEAKNVIIATGSRPANLPGLMLDGINVLSSDHLLQLPALPQSILIIGAGVIGCEWAFMLGQLDVKIEMVELLPRALPMEDPSVSAIIARELKKLKIRLTTDTRVEMLEPSPSGLVKAILADGQAVETEKVLVSVGRAFNTGDMGLDSVGVKLNRNGSIAVDGGMRTSVDGIYATGDVAGKSLLAYTAVAEGAVAVDNCLGQKREVNYLGVPSVIFTQPEVASVGLTEEKAREKAEIAIGSFPMRALGKAHAEGEIAGEVKVIGDKKTDKLLGVHMVGPHVTEAIHTAALAIRQGLTVTELGSLVFAHPVISESIMEACHNLHKMSVHLPGQR
ncbi:MAG: dihydrolipoyl dehydrogenase [candidate division Zixibacteria bacterium]|nr:dihydrolipoyl dehydrogenase [candidate division Zixibacteria bacterium]